jgi:hypothetical protein
MIHQVIIGIFAGSFYGLLGYLKSNERFSFKKFSRALIIGAFTGFYSSYSGLSLNEATSFLSSAGITVLIDFGIKVIERKIIKKKSRKSKAHK